MRVIFSQVDTEVVYGLDQFIEAFIVRLENLMTVLYRDLHDNLLTFHTARVLCCLCDFGVICNMCNEAHFLDP